MSDNSIDILGNQQSSVLDKAFLEISRASLEIARRLNLSEYDEAKVLARIAHSAKQAASASLDRKQAELREAVKDIPLVLK